MNRTLTVIGSTVITAMLMIAPIAASAQTLQASNSTGVDINSNGVVRVVGADVTSVSNGVVDAVTTIGNVVMNWVIDVSASTKIGADGSKNATTTDIAVGDKINFAGSLSSSVGSTLTVAATKIRDITSFPVRHFWMEATSSVNTDKADINTGINTAKSDGPHGIHVGLDLFSGLRLGLGH